MSKKDQRLALFARGAEALVSLTAISEPTRYVCPICTRDFSRDAAESGELTLEHVPPKSQGGRAVTLTCRRCNSHLGGPTAAASQARDQANTTLGILAGERSDSVGRVKVDLGGHILNAEVEPGENATAIRLIESANNPRSVQAGLDWFRAATRGEEAHDMSLPFQVWPPHDPHLARVDDLRTAYLAAFAKFGYRFIGSAVYEPIRTQLMDPTNETFTGYVVNLGAEDHMEPCLIRTTSPLECLTVLLPNCAVVLPWPGKGDPYPILAELRSAGGKADWRGSASSWPKGMVLWFDFHTPSAA